MKSQDIEDITFLSILLLIICFNACLIRCLCSKRNVQDEEEPNPAEENGDENMC